MPRTRRIALVVALAVVGALGITACGQERPGTAAYVGDQRFTDRQLDTMVAETAKYHPGELAEVRTVTLSWLVLTRLAQQAAHERGINPLGPDYVGRADQFEMPAASSFVRTAAEYGAAMATLQNRLTPVAAAPDTLRRYYDDMAKAGLPLDDDFETWAEDARSVSAMPIVLAILAAIRDVAQRVHVVINPRYLPLQLNVGPLPVVLAFPGSDVVRKSPVPRPSADEDEPTAAN
jgi:hypothetical protein